MKLIHGDCLEKMKDIPDGSVDMVMTDPPYGTTACKWDSIIPLELMWEQLKRVTKKNSAIVMTASQPFTTTLIASNMGMFKYCWVWDKKLSSGGLLCNKRPLRRHEDVVVFYSKQVRYNPIMRTGKPRKKGKMAAGGVYNDIPQHNAVEKISNQYYPTSILELSHAKMKGRVHPTQKPVALMEYLIKTYTNEGETVLDFCFGSGTTAIACLNTNRNFIGIEKDEAYFEIAKKRIEEAQYNQQINRTQKARAGYLGRYIAKGDTR